MNQFDRTMFNPPLRVPDLVCGPVALRPYSVSDLALVRQASADPLIPDISTIPRVYSDDAGRDFIERQYRRASEGDGYSFVIAEADDPVTGIGSIGLWLQEIESGRASVGYWLLEGSRGRRLAAHALRGVVAFAFGELGIRRLHLFVEPWQPQPQPVCATPPPQPQPHPPTAVQAEVPSVVRRVITRAVSTSL